MKGKIVDFCKKFSAVDVAIALLNKIMFFFVVIYAVTRGGGVASTVFAVVMVITIAVDFLYFALSKCRLSYLALTVSMALYIINFAGNFIIGLSKFHNSISVVSIIALELIPLVAIVFISLKAFGKLPPRTKIVSGKIRLTTGIIALCGIVSLIIVAAITFAGISAINTNIVNLATFLILLGVFLFAIYLGMAEKSTIKPKHKLVTVIVGLLLVVICTTEFAVIEGVAYTDRARNDKEFTAAFGDTGNLKLHKTRSNAYSYADEFFGVETKDYAVKRDVVYYNGAVGVESGIVLRYDVYYPLFDGAHKSVLLNLHGSGGEKDIGNYAHRNKYFASRGYVVYDIQFGDFNERNTNIDWEKYERNSLMMLKHIDEFFQYVTQHNDNGADFNNVFLTGVSMGGGLVSKYAYAFENSLTSLGATLRGIIPVYPGYSMRDIGIDNYLNYVTADSVPCLLVMSLSDVVVYRDVVDHTRSAYAKAGNKSFSCVGVTFSGHGSDGLLSGRFNQAYMYYAERFMALLRV